MRKTNQVSGPQNVGIREVPSISLPMSGGHSVFDVTPWWANYTPKVTSYVQGLPSPKFSPRPPPRAGSSPQSPLSPGVPRCPLPQGREGKGRVPQLGGRKEPPLASTSLVWFWGAQGARAEGGWGVEGRVSSHPPEHPSPRAATQPEVPTLWTLRLRGSQADWERPPFVHGPGHPPSGARVRPGMEGSMRLLLRATGETHATPPRFTLRGRLHSRQRPRPTPQALRPFPSPIPSPRVQVPAPTLTLQAASATSRCLGALGKRK